MNSRERIFTVFRCQQPDRVPYDISGFNREAFRIFNEKAGSDNPDEYFGVEKDIEWAGFKNTRLDLQERFLRLHNLPDDSKFTLNEWGTAMVVGSNPAYDHFIAPLTNIKSIKEIEEYPLPDFTADYRYCNLEKDIEGIKEKEVASIAFMAETIFEVAWQIRGFNELLADFLTNEEWTTCLLDRITELRVFQTKKLAEADIDIIFLGDDIGMEDRMMISPAIWRRWLKLRLAKIVETAREIKPDVIFCYHSDGYIEPIIPDFIEIGINVLNPIQPECMDPAKLKKKYGKELAFWGTIGIQHTLPFGTPEEVEAEVKERIETIGKAGGLYLSPTHVIAPEVPFENIIAFVEAVKKYGRY